MQYYTLTNECYLLTTTFFESTIIKGKLIQTPKITTKFLSFIDDEDMDFIARDRPLEVNWNANDLAKEFHDQGPLLKRLIKEEKAKLPELVEMESKIKNWAYQKYKPKDVDFMEACYLYVFVTHPRNQIEEKIKLYETILMYMTKRIDYTSDKIDVDRARQRPISDFIQFKRGWAKSIWNESDKTPSMHYRKELNRVHCFSTGEDEDVIGVVMKLHGCTFIEAVKIINN